MFVLSCSTIWLVIAYRVWVNFVAERGFTPAQLRNTHTILQGVGWDGGYTPWNAKKR